MPTRSSPPRRTPSPERWQAAVTAWAALDSPVGRLGLAASPRGLCAVVLPESSRHRLPPGTPPDPNPASPPARTPSAPAGAPRPTSAPVTAETHAAQRWLTQAQRELDQYFTQRRQSFRVPLDLRGTPFQVAVWQALQQIPFGDTRSYLAVALAVGRPRASRAVGQANHVNPVAIVVPCHRVIGANGALTGYGGGLDCKRWLLAWERPSD